MKHSDILAHVDHTLLKATALWTDIQKLCDEAVQFQTATVCAPPSYIKKIREAYGRKVRICTVIGFAVVLVQAPPYLF